MTDLLAEAVRSIGPLIIVMVVVVSWTIARERRMLLDELHKADREIVGLERKLSEARITNEELEMKLAKLRRIAEPAIRISGEVAVDPGLLINGIAAVSLPQSAASSLTSSSWDAAEDRVDAITPLSRIAPPTWELASMVWDEWQIRVETSAPEVVPVVPMLPAPRGRRLSRSEDRC